MSKKVIIIFIVLIAAVTYTLLGIKIWQQDKEIKRLSENLKAAYIQEGQLIEQIESGMLNEQE